MTRMMNAVRTAAGVVVMLGVPPVLLLAVFGSPIPRRLPSLTAVHNWLDDPLQPHHAALMVQAVAWLLWIGQVAAVVAILAAGRPRTGGGRIRLSLPRPLQGLTATILGAAAVTTAATPAAQAAPAVTAADTVPLDAPSSARLIADVGSLSDVSASLASKTTSTRIASTAASVDHGARNKPADAGRPSAGTTTCVVQPEDTLFDIAAKHLGDGNRWPEIFALNRGTHYHHIGGTFTDPDLIYPGWTFDLPAPPAAADHHHPPAAPRPTAPQHLPTSANPRATQHRSSASLATTTGPASTPPRVPADDGVAGPSTAASSGPATRAPNGTTPGAAPDTHRPSRRGMALPSGGWIDLGLAAAVVAAVCLIWAHRRRRYIPRPPTTGSHTDDPDLTPLPAIVTQIRRGLRRPVPIAARTAGTSTDDDPSSELDEAHDDDATDGDRAQLATAVVSAPETPPGTDGAPPWATRAGLGLVGTGAPAAVRGMLVAGLADGLDDPGARTCVVIPSTTTTTLFGAAAVTLPATPRLTVTADLADALDQLEAQALHRTRLLEHHDVDDVAALRLADPSEEPLPPIMLITDTTHRDDRTRVAALLAQGQRLDIHGVLLGDWPDGTVRVGDDGTTHTADTTTTTDCGGHLADIGRLSVISATEAADLITTLAEAHTGQPQPPTGTRPNPSTVTADVAATETPSAHPAPRSAITAPVTSSDPDDDGETAQEAAGSCDPTTAIRPGAVDDDDATIGPAAGVQVNVLGGAAIRGADPQRSLRHKAMELLVYLVVHDGSATIDAILEDLLPDAPHSKAGQRLYTYVSDLRGVLRHNGGPGQYLTHPRLRYALNPATITVDLWQMRAAITEAATAGPADPARRVAALRRAVAAYRGPLADGHDYLWIEPHREATRRQALDATTALVDALAGQPADQLAILEPAIGLHPYTEHLYRAAMRAHAHLGNLDAIRALRRAVTTAAAELEVEPDDDTLTLADDLVADLTSRRAPVTPRAGATP